MRVWVRVRVRQRTVRLQPDLGGREQVHHLHRAAQIARRRTLVDALHLRRAARLVRVRVGVRVRIGGRARARVRVRVRGRGRVRARVRAAARAAEARRRTGERRRPACAAGIALRRGVLSAAGVARSSANVPIANATGEGR